MVSEVVREIDIVRWVEAAPRDKKGFREAVHVVLTAISRSAGLRSTMIMKGGLLMAIRYDSTRFTRDADFSTRDRHDPASEKALIEELDAQLYQVNDELPYDTMCLIQSAKLNPKAPDASFPTLKIKIGYAPRSHSGHVKRLKAKQSPTILEIDYSYDEAVYEVEVLSLSDGDGLQAYGFTNLIAEKYRSLLQQPYRRRNRRQDVYDLHMLLSDCEALSPVEQRQLHAHLIGSCQSRNIIAMPESMRDPQVRAMAAEDYAGLAEEIEGELPDFELAYETVQNYYEKLPW
jgi:predicted nucleotidyltransferase component of viral defense system